MLGLTLFATEDFDFNGLGEEDIFPMTLAFVTAAMGAIFIAFTLQVKARQASVNTRQLISNINPGK